VADRRDSDELLQALTWDLPELTEETSDDCRSSIGSLSPPPRATSRRTRGVSTPVKDTPPPPPPRFTGDERNWDHDPRRNRDEDIGASSPVAALLFEDGVSKARALWELSVMEDRASTPLSPGFWKYHRCPSSGPLTPLGGTESDESDSASEGAGEDPRSEKSRASGPGTESHFSTPGIQPRASPSSSSGSEPTPNRTIYFDCEDGADESDSED